MGSKKAVSLNLYSPSLPRLVLPASPYLLHPWSRPPLVGEELYCATPLVLYCATPLVRVELYCALPLAGEVLYCANPLVD